MCPLNLFAAKLSQQAAKLASSLLLIFSAHAGDYGKVTQGWGTFHFYRATPDELTLHWKAPDGTPMRTFEALKTQLTAEGRPPVFMMNAGIFEPGGIPSGLHIENGKQLRPINLADGKGNFFLKPNGVFFIDAQGARILRSEVYASSRFTPRLALQSGPMLLINGEPHPAFRAASSSRLHRNGVGILPDGRVVFIITDLPSRTQVNLFQFAMLFQQQGCQNALFLDGDLSVMAVAENGILRPVDSKDVPSREAAPGIPAGSQFGAFLAITVPGETKGSSQSGAPP